MGRGRKPQGDRAMTDAERQRRHRQRLRQARADTVTGTCHENGAADKTQTDFVTTEVSRNEAATQKTIDRLRKENQRLRREAKESHEGWLRALRGENQEIKRLREELDRLRREASQYGDWKTEKALSDLDPRSVQKVYRDLALKYHPDRGGSKEAMQAISEFRDRLVARAKQGG
jgi:hypothetical protein